MTKHHKHLRNKNQRKVVRALLVLSLRVSVIFLCIYLFFVLFNLTEPYMVYIKYSIAVIVAILIFWRINRMVKHLCLRGELHRHLLQALQAMDSTAKFYTNEDEATRELVGILKSRGFDAKYQFHLNSGRTADAKVGNVLIEAKLSPRTEDIDRLIGQIQEYSKQPLKTNIVIYGRLDNYSRRRIEEEIIERYSGKILLTYLKHPKRTRR